MADPTDDAFEEGGLDPRDAWAMAEAVRTPAERDEAVGKVLAEAARCEEAMKDPKMAGRRKAVQCRADEMARVHRVLRLKRLDESAGPLSEAALWPDGSPRQRTNADRAAFALSEMTAAAQRELFAPGPESPRECAAPAAPPSIADARARKALREAQGAARRAGFVRFLGEVTYRAMPLDEDEKSGHRIHVYEETAAIAESAAAWALNAAAEQAIEEISAVLGECSDPEEAAGLVTAAAGDGGGPLARLVERAGSEIERRAVAAVAGARQRAAVLERAVSLHEGTEGTDAEVRARRIKKEVDRAPPTLIESLFVANRKALAEATGGDDTADAPTGLILAESVCQYALLEVLSGYGVVALSDPEPLIRALAKVS
jgi:hypothetical protein